MSTSTEIHQQTPSSDDHTITIKTTYKYAETDLQIYEAAFCNKWDDVCEFFEGRPELKTKPVNEGLETPLMIAVRCNSHEFVKQLLNNVETHDRDKWCGVDIIGNNALHYAAKYGNIIAAKLMLQCLPEAMTTIKNIFGDTPATLAVKLGKKDMIDEVFKEYADIIKMSYEYADTDARIQEAAFCNNWDYVRGLFEATPELKTKTVNERFETPLMLAVGTNYSHEFVKQLLNNVDHGDLDHDEWCSVNNSGNNALHYAAKVGNIIDAKLMVQCLPETMQTVKNIHGDTPATLAAKLGRKYMIDEVFNEYADTIEMAYEYAETDLRIYKAALRNKWDDIRRLFRQRPELMTKTVNERLETPLMIAVGTNSSHEFVKQLLNNVKHRDPRHNYEWCGVNIHGNNALHYAAKVGNIIDAKLMVWCLPRTMIWNKNIDGDTPLLLATKLGRKDMIGQVFSQYNMLSQLSGEDDNIIASTIQAGLLDLALRTLYSLPDEMKLNGLEALATKPESFRSGNRLGFWCGLICPCKSLFYYTEYFSYNSLIIEC